ncbi:MAG TPA: STAS domain-containing protein [Vicinamibacterales bacterium]|nr:STAS domain-containing protein [Vicinamibacterales bacterium]
MAVEQRRHGDVTVFVAKAPLASSGGGEGELRRAIRTAVDEGLRHVVINLQDVVDIDSSDVAELASAHITTTNRGSTLLLCCLSKKLKHIFAITRLEEVFAIFASEAEAVDASTEKR